MGAKPTSKIEKSQKSQKSQNCCMIYASCSVCVCVGLCMQFFLCATESFAIVACVGGIFCLCTLYFVLWSFCAHCSAASCRANMIYCLHLHDLQKLVFLLDDLLGVQSALRMLGLSETGWAFCDGPTTCSLRNHRRIVRLSWKTLRTAVPALQL